MHTGVRTHLGAAAMARSTVDSCPPLMACIWRRSCPMMDPQISGRGVYLCVYARACACVFMCASVCVCVCVCMCV